MGVGVRDFGLPPPCGGHEVQWVEVVAQPLPGVPVVVMVTQPLPGVPVMVMVTQPLPGVPVVRHHRRRLPGRLLLPDRRGPRVSTVHSVVGAQGGRLLQLHPGLPGRPVLWGVGGYTG